MRTPILWAGAAVVAGAVVALVGGRGPVRAQQDAGHRGESQFVKVRSATGREEYLNLSRINQISIRDGHNAQVSFAGDHQAHSVLDAQAAGHLRTVLDRLSLRADQDGAAPVPAPAAAKAEDPAPRRAEDGGRKGFRFLAFDDFDGKLGLNWKPVRPDPSHVSLTRHPGALTITTQRGSIHGDEKNDPFGEGVQAKNLTLIDNPLAPGADFVMTTCVSGFTPETSYQQAGLLVYNDDDNYLKFGYEYNWPNQGGQTFCILTETDAKSDFKYVDADLSGLKRYWVRLTKRGNRYEYATSTDGQDFRTHGAVEWGDGSPQRLGLLAKNGGNKEASELDAAFEFFELRAPAPPPTGDEGRRD